MPKCQTVTYLYADGSERTYHTLCAPDPRPIGELTEEFGKSLVGQQANVTYDAENKVALQRVRAIPPGQTRPQWIWTPYEGACLIEVRGGSHTAE